MTLAFVPDQGNVEIGAPVPRLNPFPIMLASTAIWASVFSAQHLEVVNPFEVDDSSRPASFSPSGEMELGFVNSADSLDHSFNDGLATWVTESRARIEALAKLADGWAGDEYSAATDMAVIYADLFVQRLATAGLTVKPVVGLDSDGSFSFHIASDGLLADISVYDDGTYSFYAKGNGQTAYSDESAVVGVLDESLAAMLK